MPLRLMALRYAPLLALLVTAAVAAQPLPDTLRAPADADSIAVYGWTVDADADRLLVGARVWPPPYTPPPEEPRGAAERADHHGTVFVYQLQPDGSWAIEGRLRADYISREDCFGWAMDLRGDLAVIGAECEYSQDENGAFLIGATYLYRYDGSEWVREAKLSIPNAPDEQPHTYAFGESVAVGDGFVVVGAGSTRLPSNPDEDHSSGAAFIFEQVDGVWTRTATLRNDDADVQVNEYFGGAVAVSGNSVLVGSPSNDAAGMDRSGAVYVFERTGGEWTQTAKLTAPSPSPVTYFGALLAADAEGAVVGSWRTVYPVERGGAGWEVESALVAAIRPNGVARAGGYALTVDGDVTSEQGYDAYLFEREGVVWEETRLPTESYLASRDEMVSLTSTHAFIGSPEESSGEVLVYDLGLLTAGEPVPTDAAGLTLTVAPNPIRRNASVRFTLPEAGSSRLVVYDVLGREVLRLVDAAVPAGSHEARVDAGGLAAGSYLVRLDTDSGVETRLVTVVR
ncbi:MAG: T9SS type A sorting domain-containing protein [Rhodothermales bacterium]